MARERSAVTATSESELERARPGVAVYLLAAMAVASFTASILSILSTFIIDDLDITRAQLGLVVMANTVAGGFVSPLAGRFVDRVGGGSALQTLFHIAVVAFLLTAVAPGPTVLVLAALIGGAAQALANPATNKIIAYRYPPAERANVTGVKQSGVQLAIFVGGLTLPSLAAWLGWRWATILVAVGVALGSLAFSFVRQGRSAGAGEIAPAGSRPIGLAVPWLAVYGLLMGFSGSALFFLPLYAEEELGESVQAAGIAVAIAGIAAVLGRLAWARYAERGSRYQATLAILAALAVLGLWLFTQADGATWLLWAGAVIVGASASSWNSVGMLAVIDGSMAQGAGVASGRVLLGFLVGLGAGPPIYGQTADTSGSYDTMWLIAAATAALALAVIGMWRATDGDGPAS